MTEWLRQIRDHGWRQGSVLPADLRDAVQLLPGARSPAELDVLVVVSHDCDIVHGNFEAEPTVDVLGGRAVAAANPVMLHLRNPRTLQLELPSETPRVLEFQVRDRGTLNRARLGDTAPSEVLPVTAVAELGDWLGRRYTRPAFPDAFVERLQPSRRRLERAAARFPNDVEGIYVALDPWDECPADQPYRLILRVVVDGQRWIADRNLESRLNREFYDLLLSAIADAKGIELTDHQLLPEHHVRLSDLRGFEPLDLEFLSYTTA